MASGQLAANFSTRRLFLTTPWVIGAILVVLFITYLTSRRAKRHNVIDTTWGLLFCVAAVVSFIGSIGHGNNARGILLVVMTLVWGLRLAQHMFRRTLGKGEDPRYAEMLKEKGQFETVLIIYGLQGLLAFLISAPLQVGPFEHGPMGPVAYLGVAIWLVGLLFEAIGDRQLNQFKADSANKATVMDRGLWRYTRHPNYFGDACVWVGIFVVAAQRWPGVLTIFAPAIMIYLLAFGSGKRVLERSMAKRPGYQDYMKRTSGFLPLPPRKAAPDNAAPQALPPHKSAS